MDAFELKYSVQRQELWEYYWWAWRQPDGLWIHWVIFAFSALVGGWLLTLVGVSENPIIAA